MIFETEIRFLREKIAEHGLHISPAQAEDLRVYLVELLEWGRKMNLIGLTDPKRIVSELFVDSLIPVPFLPLQGKMLDVGSGAGIPGLPIKILRPDMETHLLEPNRKKNSFLKHIIRLLKTEKIQVIKGRIEKDGGRLLTRDYDLVTVRALTDLATAIGWYSPYLKPGGLAVHFLGADIKPLLQQALIRIDHNAFTISRIIDYQLPGKKNKRHIVIFLNGGDMLDR